MKRVAEERVSWFDVLPRRFFSTRRNGRKFPEKEQFADPHGRTVLVAKARWILLLLISIYGACAGSFFYFSRYGFFLTSSQQFFLFASVVAVISYNSVYHFFYEKISRIKFIDHIQILLDILFVTMLIHFSGGADSWFWPVYLIVTIEAAFLLEQKKDVWLLGSIGGGVYGALLAAEYFRVIPSISMPFVSAELHFDYLYLVLIWSWVAILNTTTAVVLTFLMSVIRLEARLLRQSEERLLNFIDTTNDLIHSSTPDGKFIYVNHAWQQALGYRLEELAGILLWELIPSFNRFQFMKELKLMMEGGNEYLLETMFLTREGREVMVEGNVTCSYENGQPAAVWGIFRDITDRKKVQEQLYHLAHYDNLTNLPNRVLFVDRLKQAKAHANRAKTHMAVLFLDMDRFKIINDTLGHPVGDKLLQSLAKRLVLCVREIDTVARIGGDEFIIVLENLKEVSDAEKIACKVLATLSAPHMIDEHELFITASIGISMYPDDDEDLDNLIKKADVAMYAAKGQGNNTLRFYDPRMDENAHKKFVLENSMRKALEKEEFCLYYQPKVDIITGEITVMEALLRWEHPDLGLLAPGEFIPLAEETGLIVPLGEWVLNRACAQNKEWQTRGLFHLRVAVNLSGYQLQQKNFMEVVKNALEQTGLDSQYLEMEITETVIMQNPDFTVSVLGELRDMGIHISIDDFGTGYSSLSHLKRFSVNTLKIDKLFVRDVVDNVTDAAIATAIIAMGNSLNLRVTAEGVETEGQFSFLKETKCDEVQGYLFSKPIPPEKVVEFMHNRKITPQ
ncbi:MAG: sensory box/GGDEF family [Geobacteraceae bacterium]|nr:MAG: sensory box/GGDEF family [Geobacteraceae bacterium]